MRDRYGREIDYLRISLTDLCNLRCMYCMPAEGVDKHSHRDNLSLEEVAEIAAAAVELGVKKIRLTGGEPLVRRGITGLVGKLAALPGLRELTMTTNGILLPGMARELKAAGLTRVNLSLDTLDPEKYRKITRVGTLDDALAGLRCAEEAGLTPLKVNAVLIGGFNDDEIPAMVELTRERPLEMRFIELMPIGDTDVFGAAAYLPVDAVLERAPELEPLPEGEAPPRGSVARLYALPGAAGRVGLISPVSCSFCGGCNRVRLTADGFIKPCLHSGKEYPLRGLHGDALRAALADAIGQKPEEHGVLSKTERSGAGRNMHEIGG